MKRCWIGPAGTLLGIPWGVPQGRVGFFSDFSLLLCFLFPFLFFWTESVEKKTNNCLITVSIRFKSVIFFRHFLYKNCKNNKKNSSRISGPIYGAITKIWHKNVRSFKKSGPLFSIIFFLAFRFLAYTVIQSCWVLTKCLKS